MLVTENCFRIDGTYAGRNNLDYGIKEGDKVLDIGGGIKAFKYATHILDSTDEEFIAQRYKAEMKIDPNKILIDGTTDNLVNFEDNEFDFIYTSHTLEHVPNLPQALEEISRVGKRGFVAVPHCLYDFWGTDSGSGHEWFCDCRDNILLIRKRMPHDFIDFVAKAWGEVMWGEDWDKTDHWRRCWEGHACIGVRPFWEIRFFWYDYINYKIDDTMFYQLDVFRGMIEQAIKEHREAEATNEEE
jgi:SAM-dependent methyltransferase